MIRNILITGTSTGLGVSLAVQTAKAGYKVYATMRNLDKQDLLKTALSSHNVTAEILQLDVCDTDSITLAVDKIIAQDSHLDVLINNAGAGFVRTTEQATEEDIQWIMDVNFMGVVRCTKAVLPHMRKARSGHIINISSVGGLVGQPFNEIYCAAKFAVEGYTESLASYVGPAFGIHFTSVEPGGISTAFADSALAHFSSTGGMIEDEYLPLIQKYMGAAQARAASPETSVYQTPDEVAAVVMSCMSADIPPVRTRTSDWSEQLCLLKTASDPDGKKLQEQVMNSMLGGHPKADSI